MQTNEKSKYINTINDNCINYYKKKIILEKENKNMSRNFPISNKVWTSSVYNYNRSNEINTLFKNNTADNLIKSFFYLASLPNKNLTKSKRMRDHIRRSSIKRIFAANPEVKQTSDKAIINVYTYNRNRQHFIKNLYFSKHIKKYNFLYQNLTSFFNSHDKIQQSYLFNKTLNRKIKLNTSIIVEKQKFIYYRDNKYLKMNKYRSFLLNLYYASKNTKLTKLGYDKLIDYNKFINYKGIMKFKDLKGFIDRHTYRKAVLFKNDKTRNLLSSFDKYCRYIKEYSLWIQKTYPWNKKFIKFRTRKILRSKKIKKYRLNNKKLNTLNKKYMNNMYTYYLIKSLELLGVIAYIINNKLYIYYPMSFKIIDPEIYKFNDEEKNLISNNKDIDNIKDFFRDSLQKNKIYNNFNIEGLNHQLFVINLDNYNKINYDNIVSHLLSKILDGILINIYGKEYFLLFKKSLLKQIVRSSLQLLNKKPMDTGILTKLYSDQLRFNKKLPGLKYLLEKLYDKKIQLNFIKLKYIQLNIDNLLQLITSKLSKKKSSVLRILRKSIKLAKLPQYINLNKYNNTNNITKKIFNNIHYKWITGITMEAKGRLTKRFTAARALSKLKRKGSLKNLEPRTLINNIWVNPSINMVRNTIKPNIQHTQRFGKKRIGTFGVKGWISNN